MADGSVNYDTVLDALARAGEPVTCMQVCDLLQTRHEGKVRSLLVAMVQDEIARRSKGSRYELCHGAMTVPPEPRQTPAEPPGGQRRITVNGSTGDTRREVAELRAAGLRPAAIAKALCIAKSTVTHHLNALRGQQEAPQGAESGGNGGGGSADPDNAAQTASQEVSGRSYRTIAVDKPVDKPIIRSIEDAERAVEEQRMSNDDDEFKQALARLNRFVQIPDLANTKRKIDVLAALENFLEDSISAELKELRLWLTEIYSKRRKQ